MDINTIQKQFALLKNIVSCSEKTVYPVDLSTVEKIILHELPETLQSCAPPDMPALYFAFQQEYERFKTFLLYDKLIGKNVVALGGGFSSGKSSFLNSLLGCEMLPSDILPSTSVPAYLVYDKADEIYAINSFQSKVTMQPEDVLLLAHGFGKNDSSEQEITLGHLIESVFIATPHQMFHDLVLLDTPGYSKADTASYSAKTDEKIARTQLNAANYILWFVQADAGTITNSDIDFLKTLDNNIPKLIIINKADKIMPDELDEVVEAVKSTLTMKGVRFVDVLTYSCEEPEDYQKDEIITYLSKWNHSDVQSRFAYNFKVLFSRCKEYYDEQIETEKKTHSRLQHILADTALENEEASEYLNWMDTAAKKQITVLKEHKELLQKLQMQFFSEIKSIADTVNIDMPEPSEIDLLQDRITDPETIMRAYREKHGGDTSAHRNTVRDFTDIMERSFENVKPVFYKSAGTTAYWEELADMIGGILYGSNKKS